MFLVNKFPSAHSLSEESILPSNEALIACITEAIAAVLLSPSGKNNSIARLQRKRAEINQTKASEMDHLFLWH